MSIQQQPFGTAPDGSPVSLFTLRSTGKVFAKIATFGGRVTELHAPDRNGNVGTILLGHADPEGTLGDRICLASITGRFANRIGLGRFTLDGKQYQLAINDGRNTLHGGPVGYQSVNWTPEPHDSAGAPSLTLRYHDPDGANGFPGNVDVTVVYTLQGASLRIDYSATSDKPTPINLTNHAYFNLRGPGSGDVQAHVLTLNASHYTPVGEGLIPTGQIAPVQGTTLDFTKPAPIGARLTQVPIQPPVGYDHNFVLDTKGDLSKFGGRVVEPTTGRVLEFYTTEPGVQLYTGNFLNGSVSGIGGTYHQYGAFCLETQNFPDAPNHVNFPNSILRPGQTYRSSTIYRMGVER